MLPLQAVKQYPLVGGVLIDEQQLIPVLGQQVGRKNLPDKPVFRLGGFFLPRRGGCFFDRFRLVFIRHGRFRSHGFLLWLLRGKLRFLRRSRRGFRYIINCLFGSLVSVFIRVSCFGSHFLGSAGGCSPMP